MISNWNPEVPEDMYELAEKLREEPTEYYKEAADILSWLAQQYWQNMADAYSRGLMA